MHPIRLGIVEFLNTRPLIEGLDRTVGIELVPAVPSRLASMVADDRVDLGLVSLIDAARTTGQLAIVPVGMIGCDGPTLTVGLYSRVPLTSATTLSADTDSHTSVVLAQLILDRVMGVQPAVVPLDGRTRRAPDDWPQTVLLIGDKVLDGAPPVEQFPHRLDLGSAWKELTGLPFVYAAWMCKATRIGDEQIMGAGDLLDRQLRHNLTRLDRIASIWAGEHDWPVERARHYLGSLLRYRLGERERRAAELFVTMAHESGLISSSELVWADLSPMRV